MGTSARVGYVIMTGPPYPHRCNQHAVDTIYVKECGMHVTTLRNFITTVHHTLQTVIQVDTPNHTHNGVACEYFNPDSDSQELLIGTGTSVKTGRPPQ